VLGAGSGTPGLASGAPYARAPVRSGSRRALIGGGVVAALLLAWAGWVGVRQAQIPVRWQEGMFTLLDDGHAQLEFSVTTDPGTAVVCTVRMLNSGLTEVGRMDVTVGPSTERTFRTRATILTFEAASSGTIRTCAVR